MGGCGWDSFFFFVLEMGEEGCIHSLMDGEKCSAAEMHSKVWGGGWEWENTASVPRLSGSLARLRVWLCQSLMAGKEGRVY